MDEKINLDHGSGGTASHELIERLLISCFDSPLLAPLEDSAILAIGNNRIAFSTDSFVVDPIFFPGGNIGDLAVNGTVNDLAMRGASPLSLSVGLILEEGFAISELEKILKAMKKSADRAGVEIVTGDTKVVPAGKVDKIFINTSGIGVLDYGIEISAANAQPGDKVIISGTIADHGVTIISQQEGLQLAGGFQSDSAPLNHMVARLLAAVGPAIHVLRDPTRGGVATTLNEIARSSSANITLQEISLPIREDVQGACELLGFDPLYLANEGKLLAFVAPEKADLALTTIQADPLGSHAAIIGEVGVDNLGAVIMESPLGTNRLIDMLHGAPLPRIC